MRALRVVMVGPYWCLYAPQEASGRLGGVQ
nr:MAG TPA: hypothetical protein [Caudoviricetes sp.]